MPLSPVALPKFLRQYKKLSPKLQGEVQSQVEMLQSSPRTGEKKAGDLSFVRVHKFKVKAQLYLLAYSVAEDEGRLYLYSVATHENFYRDLKKYVE